MIQYSPQTAVTGPPLKAMVEDIEARLREPDAVYPMPKFYDASLCSAPAARRQTVHLHAARIGDYSIELWLTVDPWPSRH